MAELRQPIVSLLGHVDHGKTTLLDRIAGSVRAENEPGGITQHIGAIEVPGSTVLKLCQGLLRREQFRVPGLLFIDTPGHRSFETLRRRGGALADLAVLVVDAREGIMPQTRESIQILRHEKTPFAVAATKIDLLAGWRKPSGPIPLAEQLATCGEGYLRSLDERIYAIAEELVQAGFSADRYDRVTDFTRNLGIVPVSGKSGVGVPELLALLVGLSQRFLTQELELVTEGAEATILERTDRRGVGPVTSAIVYRGRLAVGDEIVVSGRGGVIHSRVRGLYRPAPPRKGSPAGRVERVDDVRAAAGIFLAAPGIENALPGGLLRSVATGADRQHIEEELARDSQPIAQFADSGVALAADTLGALEALAFECRELGIPIHAATVGPVDRATVVKMATVRDPTHRAILAFNVPLLDEALPEGDRGPVRLFRGDVMYHILEQYTAWRDARKAELAKLRRLATAHPARLEILPGFVFRTSKPAIIGIRVSGGTLRPGVRLMNRKGVDVGLLKSMQREGESVAEAPEGSELAASIDGAVVGRSIAEGDVLLVALGEGAVRALRTAELSSTERAILEEVVRIRRAVEGPFWGQ